MQTMIERFTGLAARMVLREGIVTRILDLAPDFRRLEVAVAGARFAAGQKVQFRVRGLEFRTLTPFDWTARAVSFLVWRHGPGPAADWCEALAPGQPVQMFGPRGAVDLARLPSAPIFVGDETSFALTAAWRQENEAPVAAQLYEVGSVATSAEVLDGIGLEPASLVARTDGDGHRDELVRQACDLAAKHRHAPVVLTGNVRSIRAVRDALKAAGLAGVVRAKAHWDPNRKGLD
jgi:NADPH-dependent ferric siderophore reductase